MLENLLDRFDHDYLARRMRHQVDIMVQLFGAGVGGFHLENVELFFPVVRAGLRTTGLWRRAVRNAMALQIAHHTVRLASLPPGFDGLRVLHLSDLHIDVDPALGADFGRYLSTAVRGVKFDLCVITGDFRYRPHGRYDRVHAEMLALVPALQCQHGIYGVLGNHDFVEEVLYLEQAGVHMLVNESHALEMGDQQLWLVGLDDPHLYGTYDFEKALRGVPPDACIIMLVHSPELAEQAAKAGCELYLTGHTHGGQLCLPFGVAPFVNARCPRARIVGPWRHGSMPGYTSAGVGSSGLPVRLNRPPEIVIHELRCAQPRPGRGRSPGGRHPRSGGRRR